MQRSILNKLIFCLGLALMVIAGALYVGTNVLTHRTSSVQADTAVAGKDNSNNYQAGFYIDGKSYNIANFSGTGQVPADDNVYRWNKLDNYYLFEKAGSASKSLRQEAVGSTFKINGKEYVIKKVITNVPNSQAGLSQVKSEMDNYDVGMQTCMYDEAHSPVDVYLANKN